MMFWDRSENQFGRPKKRKIIENQLPLRKSYIRPWCEDFYIVIGDFLFVNFFLEIIHKTCSRSNLTFRSLTLIFLSSIHFFCSIQEGKLEKGCWLLVSKMNINFQVFMRNKNLLFDSFFFKSDNFDQKNSLTIGSGKSKKLYIF